MQYHTIWNHPPKEIMDGILNLHCAIFKNTETFLSELEEKTNVLFIVVTDGEEHVVGYKIGYELNDEIYCSWYCGVYEKYRGRGIATKMIQLQHQIIRNKGYRLIQTTTSNKWRSMLILCIRSGYDITEFTMDEFGNDKIYLKKKLAPNASREGMNKQEVDL